MAPTQKTPKLYQTRDWFNSSVVPQRTAYSGLSPNRLWKTPISLVMGNAPDPNGLCGSAASFVGDQFFDRFDGYVTSDGYQIGMVLWVGSVFNHMANIMLLQGRTGLQKYQFNPSKQLLTCVSGTGQYNSAMLFSLDVFD